MEGDLDWIQNFFGVEVDVHQTGVVDTQVVIFFYRFWLLDII